MNEQLPDLIEELVSAPDEAAEVARSAAMLEQDDTSIGLLLESLPIEQRIAAFSALPKHRQLDVLVEMRADPREILIDATPQDQWAAIFSDIDAEELLELLDSLPNRLVDRAYEALDSQQQVHFDNATQFADDKIGHWLNHELLILPLNAKVRDGLRLVRRDIPVYCDTLYLVNRSGHFAEAIKLNKIFGAPEHLPLVELAEEGVSVLKGNDDNISASLLVQRSGYSSLPVVDENNKLLGRLDIGAASELVNEHYERQVMASAGMDEDEDLFSPVAKSAKNRALWLGLNLLTAFLASWFIGLFEATLQQVVALAVLMPVVASMGGIAGSQTLTLIIRGLALKQVSPANIMILLKKEFKVGGVNGIVWAIVVGIVAFYWFANPILGMVIGLAILLNIIAAAVAGVFIPVALDKLKIDPALSGSVILTTVTDIVGFVVFLGLGTLFLL